MKNIYDIVWEAIHTGKNAEPWVVHGVEYVNIATPITDPTPVKNDIIGEITYLPYTVPQNSVLVLLSAHISSDTSCSSQMHLAIRTERPGLGTVTLYDLIKCSEHNEHHWHIGAWLKEATKLHLRLTNAKSGSVYIRYYMDGILVDISEAYKK